MYQLKVWSLRALLVVVLIVAWIYATGPGGVSPLVLPDIHAVADEFPTVLGQTETYTNTLTTVEEILGAFGMAAIAGMLTGFWSARRPVRSLVVDRLLSWGYLAPLLLFYPLFLLWFGIGPASKLAFAAVAAFFPIAYNTLRGFQNVDRRYLAVAHAFRASAIRTDLLVKYPAALPQIISGVRVGAAIATTTVILTEMIAAQEGLGFELTNAGTTFAAARTIAIVLILVIVVAILQTAVQKTMRSRWSPTRDTF